MRRARPVWTVCGIRMSFRYIGEGGPALEMATSAPVMSTKDITSAEGS
jgi:hypothetical protein